jgi:hypothetical protein
LRGLRLSERYQPDASGLIAVGELLYHQLADSAATEAEEPPTVQKRIVEHVRMLFFDESLESPLPLERLNALGLPYETYQLALPMSCSRLFLAISCLPMYSMI